MNDPDWQPHLWPEQIGRALAGVATTPSTAAEAIEAAIRVVDDAECDGPECGYCACKLVTQYALHRLRADILGG